jgi:hypothetical protein
MDDSERSYGYSEDIYHGRRGPGGQYGRTLSGSGDGPFYPDQEHWERSYEYGPEWSLGQPHPGDFGPEEEAVRTRGREPAGGGWPEGRGRRFGRGGDYAGGESWTWDIQGPYRGSGPEGYRRSDERVHEEVCERLSANGRLDAGRMRVRVDDGEVTLEGQVRDRRSKRLAEAIADTVRGVVDVHNRLTIGGGREGGGERRGGGERAEELRGGDERPAGGPIATERRGDEVRSGGTGGGDREIGDRRPGERPMAEGRDASTGRLLEEGDLVGAGTASERERGG